MISLNDLIIIISVALTVPFLFYCVEIMYVWWPSVKETFTRETPIDAAGQLARGIWVGFAANFMDNLYWGVTWLLILIQHPLGITMMLGGSLFNIFFRQMGGILAARQHVIAASKLHKNSMLLGLHKYYWVASASTFAALIAAKFFF